MLMLSGKHLKRRLHCYWQPEVAILHVAELLLDILQTLTQQPRKTLLHCGKVTKHVMGKLFIDARIKILYTRHIFHFQ